MTRWFVGVKHDGSRELFAETTGTDPNAHEMGYAEICGPYRNERDASTAAKGKPSVEGGALRQKRRT